MEHQAYWMWYPGDFEIYHALKRHCRREERALHRPAFWRLDDCWHSVLFRRKETLLHEETLIVHGNGVGHVLIDGVTYPYGTAHALSIGEHVVEIAAARPEGLPCVYVQGNIFASGEGWLADHMVGSWQPAGYSAMYMLPSDDPEIFMFSYSIINPTAQKNHAEGVLYDFGRETYAQLVFEDITPGVSFPFFYGESAEEALDKAECYLCDRVAKDVSTAHFPARAFRYVYVPNAKRAFTLFARYEYLPLERRGHFRCSDDLLNRIWETAAYTFHLNSREFFLDGIKRDGWIWSGDAYQSFLINYYLFSDRDIIQRTMLALRGKDPVEQHINTILDYSFFWIIGIGDYYRYTGDAAFVRSIWPRMKTLMDFCLERRNAEGFAIGLTNDWVFVDWHEALDKEGPLCAEQMLLVRALEIMAECAEIASAAETSYHEASVKLREDIHKFFWDEAQGAFIDSYTSGRRNVTRHANLLAVRFGIATEKQQKAICVSVILNDDIPPITTPYFKFYELESLCSLGMTERALAEMRCYWGGMLDLGATTFWEEYDPAMQGAEHYAMYGSKYHKSLCHAWGASPIYLLGRYVLGIYPTSEGYRTFECAPAPGDLAWMEGTVPVGNGTVSIHLRNDALRVETDCDGGTLLWKEQRIQLTAGVPIELPR